MDKTFLKLVWEIQQFTKAFPDIGSLAYKLKVWQFDKIYGGPITEDIDITPYSLEMENADEKDKFNNVSTLDRSGDIFSIDAKRDAYDGTGEFDFTEIKWWHDGDGNF